MFDVEAFYEAARSGRTVDPGALLLHLRGFRNIVLWGGSHLGKAVAAYLRGQGIPVARFWDERAADICDLGPTPVSAPFTGDFHPADTLVILCIGNLIIQGGLADRVQAAGFPCLLGDVVYMGTACPVTQDKGIDGTACIRSLTCRFIYCPRISNVINHRSLQRLEAPPADGPLSLESITLVLNQVCSLGCKYCSSYMNSYPRQERVNFPLADIRRDIERFFGAVDSVGSVTLMGGEPFLHPDLSSIVRALLAQDNCGLIAIPTSGTCRIRPEQLEGLQDPRVIVTFSNYTESISEHQRELFQRSIEQVGAAGVFTSVGVPIPQWIVPPTLEDKGLSLEERTAVTQACQPRYPQLKNGKLHPCDYGNALHNLHVADYPGDYVDLTDPCPRPVLRQRIRAFLEAPTYRTCGHCGARGTLSATSKAGEQGFFDFLPRPAQDPDGADPVVIPQAVAANLEACQPEWIAARRRAVLYPAGGLARTLVASHAFQGLPLVGLLDRDPALQGKRVAGHPVFPPDALEGLAPDLILVASTNFGAEICRDLRQKYRHAPLEVIDLCTPLHPLKRLCLIPGVGRSGTSVCAGVLEILGVRFGDHCTPGDAFNPHGYYENTPALHLCEDLLRRLRDGRPRPEWVSAMEHVDELYCPAEFGPDQLLAPGIVAPIKELIRNELGAYPLAGLKQPRIVFLLPAFLEACRQLEVAVQIIHMDREREAVVASKVSYRNLPWPQAAMEALVDRSALALERYTQGREVLVVKYRDLLQAPVETARMLADRLGLPWREASTARILQFVDRKLCHHERVSP